MTTATSAAQVAARVLFIPAWLAPRLRALGSAFWSQAERVDTRASLRWLALNWSKVAAWWLTIGLGLSALLLLGALIAWRDPQSFAFTLWQWASNLFGGGALFAGKLSAAVFVLTLPLTLPLALLLFLAVLAVVMVLIIFGPVALVAGAGFAVLLAAAFTRRSAGWLSEFILKGLAKSDQDAGLIARLRAALGFAGSSVDVEGAGRLLQGDELRRVEAVNRERDKGARLLLGYVDGAPFYYSTEKHVYVTAPSRAGKGWGFIIPNLRQYEHSVFVIDPKGENCIQTAADRRALGHTIAAFDPYGLTGEPCATFDPIGAMMRAGSDAANLVTGADYLAESLVIGKDDHWNESARAVVRAFVLHLATAREGALHGRPRDLVTLRELVTGYFDVTLEAMRESEALDGLLARLAESILDIPEDERGSIVSTVRRSTKWLDNPALARMFKASPDGVTFDALRDEEKKLSVFVCLPALVFTTYPQPCRLLTTFALDTMMRQLTGRKRPTLFILDELAQLQHLPIVSRAFTLGAGYGVQVWAIFQSVAQARQLYQLDSLYGSSGVRAFFKLEDPESCDYASKCASGVLSPPQVRNLGETLALLLLDGANPLTIERVDAWAKRTGG
jgi:type IV secretion system protein VirD4